MPKKTTTIALGDLNVEVPQYTLGQLERIAEWLTANQTSGSGLGDIVRSYRELLGITFERSSPRFGAEQINDLEMDVSELRVAGQSLLMLAGLQPAEGPVDPEARAPDGASSTTSTGSSESSPPAAATLLN